MNDFEDFIKDWKKITKNTIAADGAFINNKNSKIMETIINYEKGQIEGKENIKKIIYFLVPFILILTPFQVWIGATEMTPINYIGYALMLFGLAFTYFNNRTDNFPDARVLATTTYLQKMKEDVLQRRKQHIFNAGILALFYIPGMFCCFVNYFIRGELAPTLNIFMLVFLVFMSIGLLAGAYHGIKLFDADTVPLKNELNEMIEEIK